MWRYAMIAVAMATTLSAASTEAPDARARTDAAISAGSNTSSPNAAFGTIINTWNLSLGDYKNAGITFADFDEWFYIVSMAGNTVWTFDPTNPTGTITNAGFGVQNFFGNDIIWGICWDPVNQMFWVTHIEGSVNGCILAGYDSLGVFTGDTWNLWAVEAIYWYGGMDWNYDNNTYLWSTKVGGTNVIYKLDPIAKSSAGSMPTGGFNGGTSLRGGSNFHDDGTRTGSTVHWVLTGGWNQGAMYQTDTTGTMQQSAFTVTSLADMDVWEPASPGAGNPISMFVSENATGDPIYEVDLGLTWVGINEGTPSTPPTSGISRDLQNPVYSNAKVTFSLAAAGNATLRVFDNSGRLVTTLVDGRLAAGSHTYNWNLTDGSGSRVPTGVYFYSLETSNVHDTHPITVVR